ncbi:SDR family oxidoreductase [Saccharothrix isguenensis]
MSGRNSDEPVEGARVAGAGEAPVSEVVTGPQAERNRSRRRAGGLGPGTHAIITGGSSGIGLAIARLLASRGASVSLVARDVERLDRAARELEAFGGGVATASVDVTDEEGVNRVFADLVERQGPCDVLVTSAGITHPGYFGELSPEVFRRVMDTNYFGTLWPIRAVVPQMVERGRGSIVGISSLVGMYGTFGYTAFSPAKFAVRGLLESLRDELTTHGVHVGYVCPPDVDTPHYAYEQPRLPAEYKEFANAMAVLPPDQVAVEIVRGIERRKSRTVIGAANRLAVTTFGLFPGVLHWYVDRVVRKVRRRRGVAAGEPSRVDQGSQG